MIVEIEDHVALIKLKPAGCSECAERSIDVNELAEALGEASGDNDKVRCIVLTGSEKAFAAGADIKMMSTRKLCRCHFPVRLFA